MEKGIDLSGQRFGRLTVVCKDPVKHKKGTYWICNCDCGGTKTVITYSLKAGKVRSCGCLEKENLKKISKSNLKHGMTDTILYQKWRSMKERCFNPNYRYFNRYGGRGITVCEEWLGEQGFENFAKWAYSAGYDESKVRYEQTLDRKDTDGNYCPDNCKWSNQTEQVANRSNACLITDIDGEKLTADRFDIKHNIYADMFTYRRIKKGYSASQIISEWNDYLLVNNGDYFTKTQAANYYGVCISTITKWVKDGLINFKRVRQQLYILKNQPRPIYMRRNQID